VNGKIHETLAVVMDKNMTIIRKPSGIFKDKSRESLKKRYQNYLLNYGIFKPNQIKNILLMIL